MFDDTNDHGGGGGGGNDRHNMGKLLAVSNAVYAVIEDASKQMNVCKSCAVMFTVSRLMGILLYAHDDEPGDEHYERAFSTLREMAEEMRQEFKRNDGALDGPHPDVHSTFIDGDELPKSGNLPDFLSALFAALKQHRNRKNDNDGDGGSTPPIQ